MHRILNSLLQMQSLFRLEIGLRGHKTYWNEFLWTRSNGWLGLFMSGYTCNNTHPACSPGLAAHCLLNYKLCVDWVTGSGWECSTNNYYHLLCCKATWWQNRMCERQQDDVVAGKFIQAFNGITKSAHFLAKKPMLTTKSMNDIHNLPDVPHTSSFLR